MVFAFQSPCLHLGPMSRNVIEAALAFSQVHAWPVCLIASRRQIDSQLHGGGYVDALTTETFAKRLQDAVAAKSIILARDHGGPYQRAEETGLSFDEAMARAEASSEADIKNGFSIIHIDPEKCLKEDDSLALDQFTELTQECLRRCFLLLDKVGRHDVRFEVGSDEGIGMGFAPDQWAEFLENIDIFCRSEGRPSPIAIAVPLGTKVREMENVGGLVENPNDPFWIKRVQTMQEITKRFGTQLKLHNADYVPAHVLRNFLKLGVRQINVAPELGVVETRALLAFLREYGMEALAESFMAIAYNSRKWERWLKPESHASDEEKAIMSGHYVFSTPECQELFNEVRARREGAVMQSVLIGAITEAIENYYHILEEANVPLQSLHS